MANAGQRPKKEIADALKRARRQVLTSARSTAVTGGAELVCATCSASRDVYSTPRNPGTHAKQIDRFTLDHAH